MSIFYSQEKSILNSFGVYYILMALLLAIIYADPGFVVFPSEINSRFAPSYFVQTEKE